MKLTQNLASVIIFLLAVSLFGADYMGRKFKEMENPPPVYLKRSGNDWKKQSRLIGEMKNPPKAFTISFYLPGSDTPVKTESPSTDITIYESGWLQPGTYNVTFKTEGYVDHTISNLKIKPETDCLVNIIFGTIEYAKR